MDIYYLIAFFILGCVFGSFFNVVGSRLPKNESIIYPSSHCNNCNKTLTPLELIPIFSFLLQKGKCKNCGVKLSWLYPVYEFMSGVLFALAYLSYGFSFDLLIALTFISCLLIVIASDIEHMIISDEVLIFFAILLSVELIISSGFYNFLNFVFNAIISFVIMFIIKILGDYVLKKDSMGGGDIKLMFIFGLILGWKNAMLAIFIGAFVGLPVSIFLLLKRKCNIVPFGPFLSIGAIIILLLKLDFYKVITFLS